MRIQLITSRPLKADEYQHITVSKFGEPRSLDEFDVNIVDLGSSDLWRTEAQRITSVDRISDFGTIRTMVMHRTKAIVIYSLPQDVNFLSSDYRGPYKQGTRLKDLIDFAKEIVKASFPANEDFPAFLYEKTTTTLGDGLYDADFYFENSYNSVSSSDLSNKSTTVKRSDYLYLTTLSVTGSEKHLLNFIDSILPKQERERVPDWVRTMDFFDDHEQKQNIVTKRQFIEQAQDSINSSEDRLKENMYYKSILYTNGDELVEVVLSIIGKLLSYDFSKFVDEKKEDFQVKKEEYTLIGEIKGVTSNIKSEHVSQVDVHYHGYKDKLAEENKQENVHQILIMNPFRNKPISERDPVHDTQIKLAERNGCLIIETPTLLKLYEKFVAGTIDVPFCEELFTKKTGLLTESDF